MAVSVETSPGFIQANSYSAEQTRRAVYSPMLQRGATVGSVQGGLIGGTDLQVSTSSLLTVAIAAGEVVVPGSSSNTQSGYTLRVTTAGTLTCATANPSNPRIDLIYANVVDAAYVGGMSNLGQVAISTGTPTSGASLTNLTGAPATPTTSIAIAYILVPAGATSLSSGDILNLTATIDAAGGYIMAYLGPNIFHRRNVSGASTITANSGDHIIVGGSSNTPVTLPAPFPNARVKVTNYGSGVPVVSHNASEVIYGDGLGNSGSSSFPLGTYGATATLESDGASWYITAGIQDSGDTTVGSFTNSWTTGTSTVKYRIQGNIVRLIGNIKDGTANNAAFTLPTGYRPAQTINQVVFGFANGTASYIQVATSGAVIPQTTETTGLTLDGITFVVD